MLPLSVVVQSAGRQLELPVSWAGSSHSSQLIVLLHGFPDGCWGWNWLVDHLAAHYQVMTIGLPGLGGVDYSDQAAEYSLETIAKLLFNALDQALLDNNVSTQTDIVIVGHDWGGIVAVELAECFPERFKRVVIINSASAPLLLQTWSSSVVQKLKSWYVAWFLLPGLGARVPYLFRGAIFNFLSWRGHGHPQLVRFQLQHYNSVRAFRQASYYYRSLFVARAKLIQRSVSISQPLLLIWGQSDPFLVNDMPERWLASGSAKQLIIRRLPAAGHWPHVTQAPQVANLILDFLSRKSF